MIKAVLKGGPTDILLFGLSRVNVGRLTHGQPILITPVQLAEIGIKFDMPIVIHYGDTEQDILNEAQDHGVDLKTAQ